MSKEVILPPIAERTGRPGSRIVVAQPASLSLVDFPSPTQIPSLLEELHRDQVADQLFHLGVDKRRGLARHTERMIPQIGREVGEREEGGARLQGVGAGVAAFASFCRVDFRPISAEGGMEPR